jgi:oxalate decarboxylase/phosphoglucose isomerase-like protein (cupin superfamily)
MEAIYDSHSTEPPQHYHPSQEEDFIILKGQMTVRMDGKIMILREGDHLHIPSNTAHSMWNNSNDKVIVNWKVKPALTTEYLFETFAGLAADGKTNKNGTPGFLQVSLLANEYEKVFRLSKPPFIVQKIVFAILKPFAYLAGCRSVYKKYFD